MIQVPSAANSGFVLRHFLSAGVTVFYLLMANKKRDADGPSDATRSDSVILLISAIYY